MSDNNEAQATPEAPALEETPEGANDHFKAYKRPIREILADLKRPVPKRLIKQKRKGGAQIDFVEWHTANKLLDYYAPGWEWSIKDTSIAGGKFIVHGRLILHAKEGLFMRDSFGISAFEKDGYGDPATNAEAQSFKRCAARFGLALHLYSDG